MSFRNFRFLKAVVDKFSHEEIVGSVAGDDTLLIVCVDDAAAESVVEKINSFML